MVASPVRSPRPPLCCSRPGRKVLSPAEIIKEETLLTLLRTSSWYCTETLRGLAVPCPACKSHAASWVWRVSWTGVPAASSDSGCPGTRPAWSSRLPCCAPTCTLWGTPVRERWLGTPAGTGATQWHSCNDKFSAVKLTTYRFVYSFIAVPFFHFWLLYWIISLWEVLSHLILSLDLHFLP